VNVNRFVDFVPFAVYEDFLWLPMLNELR
jgi:hypothetical protein